MTKRISNLKRLTELRNELKTLSIQHVVLNEARPKGYTVNYDWHTTKGVKSEIVEIFHFNGQPDNFTLGFAYTNSFDVDNGFVTITLKEENTLNFIFTETITFSNFKIFLKNFIFELKQLPLLKGFKKKYSKSDVLNVLNTLCNQKLGNKKTDKELVENLNNFLKDRTLETIKTIKNKKVELDILKTNIDDKEVALLIKSQELDVELGIDELEKKLKELKAIKEKQLQSLKSNIKTLKTKEDKEQRQINLNIFETKTLIDNIKCSYPVAIANKSIAEALKLELTK